MSQGSSPKQSYDEKVGKDIHRAPLKQYSVTAKSRIVLDGLKGEDCIVELFRQNYFYRWSYSIKSDGPGSKEP
ncbi:hypothetical protein [Celeribacter sp. PS-C1]|uniref:hypothetical protein n=1 Tax=Celeribacter sp. PS-C1 TaxID=2820813 RepID=UPI001CA4A9D3|nr:hypothetical protein [Celeribacter sp. PS-C1]MBW6419565.1 hypothetical protein [Celeribacter sp. PS-C1]